MDASVAVKWFLREPGSAEALALLDDEALELGAPDLALAEIASVLTERVRRGEIDAQFARESFLFADSGILFHSLPSQEFLPRAFELALVHDAAVYDCVYLAAALETASDLITAEVRFFNSVARVHAHVRLLDYQRIPRKA